MSRTTLTRKVHVLRFVQSSVAVQVTVVLPTGNALPDGGAQTTETLVSSLSVAVGGEYESGTVEAVPQRGTVLSPGH